MSLSLSAPEDTDNKANFKITSSQQQQSFYTDIRERVLLIWQRPRRRKINSPIIQQCCLSPCLCNEKIYLTRLWHYCGIYLTRSATSYSPFIHTGYIKTKKFWYLPLQSRPDCRPSLLHKIGCPLHSCSSKLVPKCGSNHALNLNQNYAVGYTHM